MIEKLNHKQQECINCNLCGSNTNQLFLRVCDHISKEEFNIVKCSRCGLLFLNPRPTQEAIVKYYPFDYYYKPGSDREGRLKKKLTKRINDRIKAAIRKKFFNYPSKEQQTSSLLEALKTVLLLPFYLRLKLVGRDAKIIPHRGEGRLLEIGWGNGRFLSAQRKLGWKVYGVDKSPYASKIAQEDFGLDVFCGELEDAQYQSNSFDVVYMEHVFEHVPDPSRLLKEIHRILEENGILIVKMPNVETFQRLLFGKYWSVWEVPRHLYFYGPRILKEFATKSGFKIMNIRHDFGNGIIRGSLRTWFKNKYNIDAIDNKLPRFIFRTFAYLFAYFQSSDVVTVYFKKQG